MPPLVLLLTFAAAAIAAASAGAQVPVKELAAEHTGAAPAARTPAARTDESARLGELFHRLQVMQQEVQELRGTVEEQAYQIARLTRQQQEQYIDLDQRLVAMRNESPAPGAGTAAPRPSRPAPSASGSGPPEREAYTRAFELMKESRFEESADAFNQVITDYPNGQYTANAFYWLGELYLAADEVEQARQSFAQVLALYPEHRKVADALYKLGVVHHRLEDNERALGYLNRVVAEHPDSAAAGLARTYAAELR